jgi:Prealbumin-like fold domain
VSNTHGGTAVATDWTLTAGPNGVSGAGGASGAVSAGTYTLSESAGPSGYTAGSWSCTGGTFTAPDQIAVANGESASCDITNSDQAANLTLTKHVSNTHGGTAVATDWTLTAGPNGVSGAGGASGAVSAGTYTLSESAGPSGYTAGSWSCTGGTFTAPDQIAVANGESASCDITNSDVSPQLIVIKHVINDNGGTKVAADFTMNVTATNPSSSSFAGAESPGTTITLDAGSYSADETALSGYTKSLSADCSGTIAVGQTKTCTITNNDIPQVVAQITPTATTCQLFAAGTSATLDTLQYSLKGPGAGTINQVSPGVFFYWVKVTGGGSYTITQTVSQTGYVIPFASGSFVYDSSCTKLSSATVTQNTTSGTVTATFTGTGTFYIGIKYDPTALKGKAAPNPSTVTYTFATTGVAGSTQGLSLVKK